MNNLIYKIKNKQTVVGIVGVGYVGEALGLAIASAGFKTIGFENSFDRIKKLQSRLPENFNLTQDKKKVSNCDVICICVPTPLNEKGEPDYSILQKAAREVSVYLRKEHLVIIESSVAPGTTRNMIKPILETSKWHAGKDFFLAYSPERVDPGNKNFSVSNIPKVVSGINESSLKCALAFYNQVVEQTVSVSSCETAEMTKVMENVFRLINISLVNEMADYARVSGINMWEVIDAAATKPFGFLPHYPGPGAGGYCIPVLPMYLLESAQNLNVELPLIKHAANANKKQPEKVANLALKLMNGAAETSHNGVNKTNGHKNGNGHKPQALLVGVSYKKNVGDTRESVAIKIWDKLEAEGVKVHYHDPYVDSVNGTKSSHLDNDTLDKMDVIIVTTEHENISYKTLVEANKPLLDTKNALNKFKGPHIYHI